MAVPRNTSHPACLALANTLISDRPGRDVLVDPVKRTGWLRSYGVSDGAAGSESLIELRTAIRRLLDDILCRQPPSPGAMRSINAWTRVGMSWPMLDSDGSELLVRQVSEAGALERLLGEAARSAVGLVSGPACADLRACAGEGCRLYFLTAHPRRRWCDSAKCGNRARVGRHRAAAAG